MHYHTPATGAGASSTGQEGPESGVDELSAEMAALEAELRRDGWETVATAASQRRVAVQTHSDKVVIVHETAHDQAAAVKEAFQAGGVLSSCIYQTWSNDRLIGLLALLSPGTEHAILLPTIINNAEVSTIESALGNDTELYSVLTHPSGRRIGAVKHTNPTSVLPTISAPEPPK